MNGGEFRLTWGRIAALAGVLAAIPSIWAIGGHYMNKEEIVQAMQTNKDVADKALKAHADHDASVQAWNQYGFAANRVEYLEDKAAECEAKRIASPKLTPADSAICARYETKLKTKQQEASDLKSKANESTKEK
jgi:hypothetical protein